MPHPELLAALSFGDRETDELAVAIAQRKINAYLKTLTALASSYGQDAPTLTARMTDELELAARREAELIVAAYNDALATAIDDALGVSSSEADFLARIEEWSHARAERQAPVVGVTSTYDAHADATIQFFVAAGADPGFDFGGHGDAEPACKICRALASGNPWTAQQVVAIGTPHIGCRQSWHPRKLVSLPADYVAGVGGPAGIVSSTPLNIRLGSLAAAVEFVRSLA